MSKAKMQEARIPLAKPVFDDEMKEAAIKALQNERYVHGESVFKFEEEFWAEMAFASKQFRSLVQSPAVWKLCRLCRIACVAKLRTLAGK